MNFITFLYVVMRAEKHWMCKNSGFDPYLNLQYISSEMTGKGPTLGPKFPKGPDNPRSPGLPW